MSEGREGYSRARVARAQESCNHYSFTLQTMGRGEPYGWSLRAVVLGAKSSPRFVLASRTLRLPAHGHGRSALPFMTAINY